MEDSEYLFRETERERKRNARGAFNKVRQGGRYVRMPSDNLSKKEKREMNGEVKSYDFGKMVAWKEFRSYPRDLQQQYLDMLVDRFVGLPNVVIAEAMGTKSDVFNPYCFKHGLKVRQSGTGKHTKSGFLASEAGRRWGEFVMHDKAPVVEPAAEIAAEPVAEIKEAPVVAESVKVNADVSNIALLLGSLVGTGAKITIEFVL